MDSQVGQCMALLRHTWSRETWPHSIPHLAIGMLNAVDRKDTLSFYSPRGFDVQIPITQSWRLSGMCESTRHKSLRSGSCLHSSTCVPWSPWWQACPSLHVGPSLACSPCYVPDSPHTQLEHKWGSQRNLVFGGMRRRQFTFSVCICSVSSFLHPPLEWRKTILGEIICPKSSLYSMRCSLFSRAEWHYGGRNTVETGSQGPCRWWSLALWRGSFTPHPALFHVVSRIPLCLTSPGPLSKLPELYFLNTSGIMSLSCLRPPSRFHCPWFKEELFLGPPATTTSCLFPQPPSLTYHMNFLWFSHPIMAFLPSQPHICYPPAGLLSLLSPLVKLTNAFV